MNVARLREASSRKHFGGKAANLSKLINAGLPVPEGFAISIGAFNKNRLSENASSSIRKLVHASKLYAVRSSAVNEDAKDSSWAGQFETFLNVRAEIVPATVEKCHTSTKARAKAYGKKMASNKEFKIAVVVQEMLTPDHAGVLFTRNPLTGADEFVVEYIAGIGENLVSGKVDPERFVANEAHNKRVPFNVKKLMSLAQHVAKLFGSAQDIEFAVQDDTIWLLQSRPITTLASQDALYLGEPADLFYWGPSRTEPLYMSDFMVAAGEVFRQQQSDPAWPSPPKTLALFHDHYMVWLSNAAEFNTYAAQAFEAYLRSCDVEKDHENWVSLYTQLDKAAEKKSDVFDLLVACWKKTIYAEFSLYGAELVIGKMLQRLSPSDRQRVWQECTLPDVPTFLQRIDNDIRSGETTESLVKKYPWVQDGYAGVTKKAAEYFDKRRPEISGTSPSKVGSGSRRAALAKQLGLSRVEIKALDLARELGTFMDNRKEWIMRTRRYLKKLKTNPGPTNGWIYDNGSTTLFRKDKTARLWKKYVDYKTMREDLNGTVASKTEDDIVEGEVVVISSPSDSFGRQKILVAPSTSPSYISLMRHAKALITNHGGMMSHAAIVAREFGLPCIVGTKTATKQLRTGDRVVMDLTSGAIQRV